MADLARRSQYDGLWKLPNLKWIPLFGSSCITIPVTEWLRSDAQFTLIVSHGNGQDLQYLTDYIAPLLASLVLSVSVYLSRFTRFIYTSLCLK